VLSLSSAASRGCGETNTTCERVDDVCAIRDAIQHRLAQPRVRNHLGPFRKRDIRCENQGCALDAHRPPRCDNGLSPRAAIPRGGVEVRRSPAALPPRTHLLAPGRGPLAYNDVWLVRRHRDHAYRVAYAKTTMPPGRKKPLQDRTPATVCALRVTRVGDMSRLQ